MGINKMNLKSLTEENIEKVLNELNKKIAIGLSKEDRKQELLN
jgi:uncharacterized metal-binding protein